jgi:hypothetical protein
VTDDEKRPKGVTPVEAGDFDDARKRLYLEIVALRDAWDHYLNLFTRDQESVEVLNACASSFFGLAQRAILREVLLGISRLTDSLQQGRHINLSLPYLLLDPEAANKSEAKNAVDEAIRKATEDAKAAKEHRHKYIAHLDANVATNKAAYVLPQLVQQQIEQSVSSIEAAYQVYSQLFRGSHVVFTTDRPKSSSRLVEILRASDRWALIREARERSKMRQDPGGEVLPS